MAFAGLPKGLRGVISIPDGAAAGQVLELGEQVDWSGTSEGALETAEAALMSCQGAGDPQGIAHALRLFTHVCCWRAELLKAAGKGDVATEVLVNSENMLTDQRRIFHGAGDAYGSAMMLLALSELDLAQSTGGQLDPKNSSALDRAVEAVAHFRRSEDSRMEPASLLVLSRIHQRMGNAEKAQEAAIGALKCHRSGVLPDSGGQALALHEYAASQLLLSKYDEAMRTCYMAADLCKQIGDKRRQALQLHCIAKWQHERGDNSLAIGTAQEALALFRKASCSGYWEAPTLGLLVELYVAISSPKDAMKFAEDGIERYRLEGGREREVAKLLCRVACVHVALDDTEAAMAVVEEAVLLCRSVGDTYLEVSALHAKALVYSGKQDFDEALKAMDTAIKMFTDAGGAEDRHAELVHSLKLIHMSKESFADVQKLALLHLTLVQASGGRHIAEAQAVLETSIAYGLNGNVGRAEIKAMKAHKMFSKLGDKRGEARALFTLAWVFMTTGEHDEALSHAEQSKALAQQARDAKGQAAANEAVFHAHLAMQNFSQATKASKDATATLRSIKDYATASTMACLTVEGSLETLQEHEKMSEDAIRKALEDAVAFSQEAQSLAQVCGQRKELALARFWSAQACMADSRADDALQEAKAALADFRQLGDTHGQMQALTFIGGVQLQGGSQEEAEAALDEATKLAKIRKDNGALAEIRLVRGDKAGGAQPNVGEAPRGGRAAEATTEGTPGAPSAYRPPDLGLLKSTLVNIVVSNFGVDADIDEATPLMEAGLDSLSAVEFRTAASKEFGLPLPATVMFNYPSIGTFSEMLLELMAEKEITWG